MKPKLKSNVCYCAKSQTNVFLISLFFFCIDNLRLGSTLFKSSPLQTSSRSCSICVAGQADRVGVPGGPPLATNHDIQAKALEYLLQYELSVLWKASRLEEVMKVKEFIHFGLISQGPSLFLKKNSFFVSTDMELAALNNTCYPLMILVMCSYSKVCAHRFCR
jgi:hypothetical protein